LLSDLAEIIIDLRAEGLELYEFLQQIEDPDWARATAFKNWTVNDVVAHLYFGDYLGIVSHQSSEEFLHAMAQVKQANSSLVEYTRKWSGGVNAARLRENWYERFVYMCDIFAASDPDMRLTWAGPDMGIKMFATARLMETWAHGWEIYDLLASPRQHTDRIHHIATIGAKTFGWTFANRQIALPGPVPQLQLRAPSGEIWEWHTPQSDNRIRGEAVEFCQVVTQVRNIDDTQLEVVGETAAQWMSIAQCFAGPPEDPPRPGTRGRVFSRSNTEI
jgi:uncharacterized protein (TIGR03084 family)